MSQRFWVEYNGEFYKRFYMNGKLYGEMLMYKISECDKIGDIAKSRTEFESAVRKVR